MLLNNLDKSFSLLNLSEELGGGVKTIDWHFLLFEGKPPNWQGNPILSIN